MNAIIPGKFKVKYLRNTYDFQHCNSHPLLLKTLEKRKDDLIFLDSNEEKEIEEDLDGTEGEIGYFPKVMHAKYWYLVDGEFYKENENAVFWKEIVETMQENSPCVHRQNVFVDRS